MILTINQNKSMVSSFCLAGGEEHHDGAGYGRIQDQEEPGEP